jgi:hypothetical protein
MRSEVIISFYGQMADFMPAKQLQSRSPGYFFGPLLGASGHPVAGIKSVLRAWIFYAVALRLALNIVVPPE